MRTKKVPDWMLAPSPYNTIDGCLNAMRDTRLSEDRVQAAVMSLPWWRRWAIGLGLAARPTASPIPRK